MPLYEFSDDLGNRHRRDVEDLTQLPDGVTVTGRVFGALADGSGGFVTDGATFDTLTEIVKATFDTLTEIDKAVEAQQQTPAPPAPAARPEAQYPPLQV